LKFLGENCAEDVWVRQIYIFIYIYIYRERERERGGEIKKRLEKITCCGAS